MIEILKMKDKNTIGINVDGKVEKADIERVFGELENASGNGKIKLYVEVSDFNLSDLSFEALKKDLQLWFANPGIITDIEKVALVSDSKLLKAGFDAECALIPTMTGKNFSFSAKDAAKTWLKTDQRADSRMDLTFGELAETSFLKAAGGFALGVLVGGLLSETQRTKVGKFVLIGTVAAGVPLAVKVLNNNRNLLCK
jgi:hypothetical protein